MIARDKPIAVTVAFAHNDPVGTWQLHATDFYTRKTVSAALTLQE